MRDARIGRRSGQVDLGFKPPGYAAPPDPHFRSRELDAEFLVIDGELDRCHVDLALGDYAVEVTAIGGDDRHPDRPGIRLARPIRLFRLAAAAVWLRGLPLRGLPLGGL